MEELVRFEDVVQRKVAELVINQHGREAPVDVNGLVAIEKGDDRYAFVAGRGKSVVENIMVRHDMLNRCRQFFSGAYPAVRSYARAYTRLSLKKFFLAYLSMQHPPKSFISKSANQLPAVRLAAAET